ncbi:MAG: TRAP-type transport system small permease protein [Clostridiales bacterium]|jgi:TRAP-type C4-dicarboxylate transport system permease small subunit|nr:TRAP-type transport system small permease protein [Clostridiales bacterium]MDK2934040.1 TRAP-type transport system small permease protein [Clostridiales bacterium]
MKALEATKNIIMTVFKYIVGTTFGAMIVVSFLQVLFRYVLHNSLTWSEELARYLFVWSAFLGAAIAYDAARHVEMDLVTSMLKPGMKKIFRIISYIVIAIFLYYVIQYGFQIVVKTMTQPSPALRIPMGYVYLAIPIGAIGMALVLINNILEDLTGSRKEEE